MSNYSYSVLTETRVRHWWCRKFLWSKGAILAWWREGHRAKIASLLHKNSHFARRHVPSSQMRVCTMLKDILLRLYVIPRVNEDLRDVTECIHDTSSVSQVPHCLISLQIRKSSLNQLFNCPLQLGWSCGTFDYLLCSFSSVHLTSQIESLF